MHAALLEALTRLPVGARLVLLSRSDPPPAYAALRAQRQMDVLGWEELRLTREEVGQIAASHGLSGASDRDIDHLHEIVDGWTAGLLLILEDARRHGFLVRRHAFSGQEQVFDYFASEILDRLDETIREFLLKTAWLPDLTAAWAQQLTGNPSAEQILSALHRNNHFTEERLLDQPVYQYHFLFREFLLRRSMQTFSAAALTALQRQAAALLHEGGREEDAVPLLVQASAWSDLARVILHQAPKLVEQARHLVLTKWLHDLPAEIVHDDPWLSYWEGVAQVPYDMVASRRHLTRALARFRAEGELQGYARAWIHLVTTYVAEFHDFQSLDPWIEEILAILPGSAHTLPRQLDADLALAIFSALMFRQRHHPQLPHWTERVEELVQEGGAPARRVAAGARLLLHYTYSGEFSKAARLVALLRPLVKLDTTPPFLVLEWLAHEVAYHWLAGSPGPAIDMVRQGLERAATAGIPVFNSTFCAVGTWDAVTRGDHRTATELLDRMAREIPSHRLNDVARYQYLRALDDGARGNFSTAMELAASALELADRSGFPFSLCLCSTAVGHLLTERGEHEEATRRLEAAHELARAAKTPYLEFVCGFYRAHLAFRRGEPALGRDRLRETLRLGRENSWFVLAWWQPDRVTDLCVKALEAGIEVEYVQEFVRRRHLVPRTPPLHLEEWPWGVRIFTLGRFDVVVDGRSLRSAPDWRRKTLYLLKALIALGGRDVQEWQLLDALWPDADGDLAHRSFATTLYRLRKLLGVPEALRLRGGRLTLDDHHVWVDVWALERVLDLAEKSSREASQASSDREHRIIKVMGLYRGSFLAEDADQPWSFHRREGLRSRFLHAVKSSGQVLERCGRTESAAALYRKALEVEASNDVQRRLAACAAQLGQKREPQL
ncbi:MAG: hypothetical protein AB1578_12895 [Thermodesulfobacteriota bacterium]